ncbi:MAG TPA: response regulator transcription factor [Chloroflexota bacterium]|nr:response regulator transcription factor [Chloroflexota bacterium]
MEDASDQSPIPAVVGAEPRIMLVEDDRGLRQAVRHALEGEGYAVGVVGDAFAALERLSSFRPHVLIVDLMLPRGDGLEFVRRVRRRPGGGDVAVIIMTARDSVDDRLEGFNAGADDYVVKPVAIAELLARVKARLRHVWSPSPEVLEYADVRLDTGRRVVVRGAGTPVERRAELTTTEYHLLELFMRNPEQVLSRRAIGERLWGVDFEAESIVIDVYVRRLRRKLEARDEPPLIHTVRGSGYTLRRRVPDVA